MKGWGGGLAMTSWKISKCSDRAENWYGNEFRYVDYKNEANVIQNGIQRHQKRHRTSSNVIERHRTSSNVIERRPTSSKTSTTIQSVIRQPQRNPSTLMPSKVIQNVIQRHPKCHHTISYTIIHFHTLLSAHSFLHAPSDPLSYTSVHFHRSSG